MSRNLLVAIAFGPGLLMAQSLNKPKLGLHDWAGGFTQPVCVENCGDSRLFVVEKTGVIRIVSDSMVVVDRPFLDITDRVDAAGNEQGLLGLAFEPDYAETGFFYVYYIFGTGSGSSRISRFQVTADPDSADAASEQVIYEWPQPEWNHNGGTIHFGPDGYLYMAFGDGGGTNDTYENGQDYTEPLGGFIRIDVSAHDDGFLIPPDNPFADEDGTDTLPEIWATGLRNPFRWSFDRLTGDVWIGDVGQVTWEEVDFWPGGDNSCPNFGWRCREGFSTNVAVDQGPCGDSSDYVSPVAAFDHVAENQGGQAWCSVIGGYVYRGSWYPHHDGHYIFTDYCSGDFITFAEGGTSDVDTMLMTTAAGYSGFGQDVDGQIYVANHLTGWVQKLFDPCPMADPVIMGIDAALFTEEGLGFQWLLNGVPIPGATEQGYLPEVVGNYQVLVDFGTPCVLISDTVWGTPEWIADDEVPALRIYPQPAGREVIIEHDVTADGAGVELCDISGRTVHAFGRLTAGQRMELDVSAIATGSYVLRCAGENGNVITTAPLIIAR